MNHFQKITNNKLITHIILFISIILLLEVISYWIKDKFDSDINTSMQILQEKVIHKTCDISLDTLQIDYMVKKKIESYLNQIDSLQTYYSEITKLFYEKYYKSTMIFIISTVMTSLLLLVITKDGLKKANKYIVTIFLAFLGYSAYSGSFALAFQHEENIQKNIKALKIHQNIKNRILSDIALWEKEIPSNTELNNFFCRYDKELDEAFILFVDFDQDSAKAYIQQTIGDS